MKQPTSKELAKALIRSQAVTALQALTALATVPKPTLEQLKAARRARRNAELIRTLDQ